MHNFGPKKFIIIIKKTHSERETMKIGVIGYGNMGSMIVNNILKLNLLLDDEELIVSKNLTEGDYVMISLSSSSMLLSENDLECMFDPYKIVDTSNRKNLLRAITLACVKNLVQSLKGFVWVESTILKNTSFNIIIPSNKAN
jgi:signal transduction histidine kinase